MAETGTFLSKDPIESEPPYLYVRGNPINAVDPSELCPPGVPICRGPDGRPIDQYYRYGDRGDPVSLSGPNPWFPTHQGVNADEFAQLIIQNSSTSVGALIRLFEINGLPGKDAKGRLRWILYKTASIMSNSYLQFGLFPADDSGFCKELADGEFYANKDIWGEFDPGPSVQMGHFLTAIALGFDPEGAYYQAAIFDTLIDKLPRGLNSRSATPIHLQPPHPFPADAETYALNLIVGHEMLGDQQSIGQLVSIPNQYYATTEEVRVLFLKAVEADRNRNPNERDRYLQTILGDPLRREAIPGPDRIGNSMPDLRLSVKGWRFGQETRNGPIQTRQQAADWLRREVYDPFRTR